MDTKVNLLGCVFENPILPASGPLVEGLENLLSLSELPLGGLVTKTISVAGARVQKPCIVGTKHLLYNAELWSEHPIEYWVDALQSYKTEMKVKLQSQMQVQMQGQMQGQIQGQNQGMFREKPLGISVGYTADDFKIIVPQLNPFADFYEVSTHYAKDALENIVKTMVSLTDKPVLIKLSPHIIEDLQFVEDILSYGAKGVVALNSFGPGVVLDLKNRQVKIGDANGHAWVSGPAIKPFVLQRIANLRRHFPDMVLIGCGGIETPEDVLEMVMAGADLVQMLSSALIYGRYHYTKVVEGLVPAMAANGIASIKSLREEGFSTSPPQIPTGEVPIPCINLLQCTGCFKCVRVCPFEAYGQEKTYRDFKRNHTLASGFVNKPMVDESKCIGCGLCISLCPASAIKIREVGDSCV